MIMIVPPPSRSTTREGAFPDNRPPPARRATPQTLTGPRGTPAFLPLSILFSFSQLVSLKISKSQFPSKSPRPRSEDGLLLCNGSSVSKLLGFDLMKTFDRTQRSSLNDLFHLFHQSSTTIQVKTTAYWACRCPEFPTRPNIPCGQKPHVVSSWVKEYDRSSKDSSWRD